MLKRYFVIFLLSAWGFTTVHAMNDIIALNLDEEGRALNGYDAVAYVSNQNAVEGDKKYSHHWNEAEWYFRSVENKIRFIKEPEKYAPANGGYCTFGVMMGKKFDGDPESWLIHNDKLYVFLNNDIKEKFMQDTDVNLMEAKNNWPDIKNKTVAELE
jgi:YHS domain-containing protein